VVINEFQKEELSQYLHLMIPPLYRLTRQTIPFKSKEFAQLQGFSKEILKMLQKKLGPKVYFEAFTKVRNQVEKKKSERRNKKTSGAVKNPEKAAKQKLRKNEKKKESRKRKAEQFQKEKPWKKVKRASAGILN